MSCLFQTTKYPTPTTTTTTWRSKSKDRYSAFKIVSAIFYQFQ